jgi:hypothetical protein
MFSRRLAVVPFAAAAATLLFAPTASAAGSGCTPKGSKTLVANKVARVYTTNGGERLYGCLRTAKRPLLIVERNPADDIYRSRTYEHVTLAGRFVGWYGTSTDSSCKADCPPDFDATHEFVSATDLKSRKSRYVDAIATGVAVSSGGLLAWSQAGNDQDELRLSKSGEANTLVDSGEITEVSFQNAYLLWRNSGQARWTKG